MSEDTPAPVSDVQAQAPSTNSGSAFQQAARVLRFAEGETDSRLFDHWMTLAEKWMELGSIMSGDE